MTALRCILCGIYIQQFIEEVHDIKSLVHTLEGIGKGKIYVRKKVKMVFYRINFFGNLR